VAIVFGGGTLQHAFTQQVVAHDVPSQVHWEPTQCRPDVEQVPLLSVQKPPAPSEPPQATPVQLGVLHAPR
jgi:hypothetical protein